MRSLVVLLLGLAACQPASPDAAAPSTPETAVRGFLEAIGQQNFDKAKLYATETTRKNYINILQTAVRMNAINAEDYQKRFSWKLDSLQCTPPNETKVTCTVCCATGGGPSHAFSMVAEGKTWKVAYDLPLEVIE